MDNKKRFDHKEYYPETAPTQEVDLKNMLNAATETATPSDFDAITEQIHLAPDTLSTIEIDLQEWPSKD
jgi:hypothetical protein